MAKSKNTKNVAIATLSGVALTVFAGFGLRDKEGIPIVQTLFSKDQQIQSSPSVALEKSADAEIEEKAAETKETAASQTPAVAEEPKKTDAEEAEKQASLEQPKDEPKAEAVPLPSPTFDVMRVEPDGSVVIAGKAKAGSIIEIIDGNQIVGKGKAGDAGDFAVVFDQPLLPGDHALKIRQTDLDGTVIESEETGIVGIPTEAGGSVIAMVDAPGAASRILQKPEELAALVPAQPEKAKMEEPKVEPIAEETKVEAVAEEPKVEPSTEVAKAEEAAPKEPSKPAEIAKTEPEAKQAVPESAVVVVPVLVQAVDVEPNKVFVAGTGQPGRTVGIYLDNAFKGSTRIGEQGSFVFEFTGSLEAGKHDLRVDMLAETGGEVLSRASVIVDHQVENEAVKTAEAATVKPAEPAAIAAEAGAIDNVGAEQKPAEPAKSEVVVADQASSAENSAAAPKAVDTKPAPVVEAKAAEPVEQVEEKQVIQTGRSVIIRKGDSLWRVSRRMFGAGRKYTLIFDANSDQIKNPAKIWPGQVFDVPDEEESLKEKSLADNKAKTAG